MSLRKHRRSATPALAAMVALAAVACGSPAVPALEDPKEIVTAALTTAQAARSFHADLTVDGSITADLTGTEGPGTSLPLTGTVAAADFDVANDKARLTFAIPAFLNMSGEVIEVGKTSYVRTSLGGPKYQVQETTDDLPVDPTDTAAMIEDIGEFLSADGVDPVKGEDVDCGDKKCYSVAIDLTADEIAALGGPSAPSGLPVDVAAATVNLAIRVEKDTHRLSGLTAVVGMGEQGSITITLTLSNWDVPVDITPPSADQIEAGT